MNETKEEGEGSKGSKNFCGFPSMEEFSKNGMRLIVEATKAVNALPSGSSRDLYSAYPSFSKVMAQHKNEVLSAIQSVLQYKEIKGSLSRRDEEEKFEIIQECNDTMLEAINYNLDEMQGIRKTTPAIQLQEIRASPVVPQKYHLSSVLTAKFEASPHTARLITAKNILRPQAGFKVPVDNSANNPFIPRIKDKPNSLRPLAVLPEYDDDGNIVSYLHPYELEIERFEPTEKQMLKREPQVPENMDNFPHTYVDTEEKLNEMVNELREAKEVAVDLEHHSYRTFLGITCLMQLSTRTKDYIIDTIALREELHLLNEIFTRSSIVKVFHGADSDIEWLQRDLSLYIVNMFDTHQAAKRLGLARLSLAFLLKHYCNIDADKTFQLADWRMRPLPEQLLKYAQQDTHFLLYIYDMMVNDLLKFSNDQTTLLKGVYHDSKILCMKRYIKPVITSSSFRDLYLKSKRSFNNQQLYALREIYAWRDKIAREEDESYPYVLPNHMLLQISESLPREMQGILACCNPIPPLVRQQLNTIHQIILKAREQPVIKPIINESVRPSVNLNSKRDLLNHPLYSPHDLSHQNEIRDDLPTLIGSVRMSESLNGIEVQSVKLSVFDKIENGHKNRAVEINFISPYHRYKSMIPFMEAQRKKEAALEEERRKQMLEEKKKQMPELEIVKIGGDEETVEVPLRDLKRAVKPGNDDFKSPHKRWKKDNTRSNSSAARPTLSNDSSNAISSSNSSGKNEAQLQDIDEKLKEVATIVDTMKKNNRRNKKGKPQKASDFRQNSNKPVPFDYTNVNYERFQGGSSGAAGSSGNKNSKAQQKFKGGKKSKGGGNLDKMFNFSNFKLNKK